MTDTERIAIIASRVQAARLRRALLVRIYIGVPIAFNGGQVIRISQRTLRYEKDGVTVITFTGAWKTVARKMLEHLGCWSQADTEREIEIAERIAEENAA